MLRKTYRNILYSDIRFFYFPVAIKTDIRDVNPIF